MKMNCKGFNGLLGIFLAFSLAFVACNNSNDGIVTDPTVNTINSIEFAFFNMLKTEFVPYPNVSGSDVTVTAIKKMSNWGQTDSEYSVKGKDSIVYNLNDYFGTAQVMSDGAAVFTSDKRAVLMTGPNAWIKWGGPTGDRSDIESYYNPDYNYDTIFRVSGSDEKSVTYPYTVTYPSGSDAKIKGNLNLTLIKQ